MMIPRRRVHAVWIVPLLVVLPWPGIARPATASERQADARGGDARSAGAHIPAWITSIQQGLWEDHDRICSFGSRFAGQEGMARTADFLSKEMAAAGITRQWRQPVELVLPVTHACTMTLDGGPPVAIHPVWPNGANICATTEEGIRGEAVYVGDGALSELPVDALPGRIAVMEFNSREHWQYAAMYGARAILFLRPRDTSWTEAHKKFTHVTLPLPRFYLDDPVLSEQLRGGIQGELRIRSDVRWERRVCHNILGFIPGSDPAKRDVVAVLHARYDACSAVPDLAPGAEQAINTAYVLQLARHFARSRPAYSVLVAFVCGDTYELTGSRRLMKTLSSTQLLLRGDVGAVEAELVTLRSHQEALCSDHLIDAIGGWNNRDIRHRHVLWQTRMRLARLLSELSRLRRTGGDEELEKELDRRRVRLLKLQQRIHHDNLGESDLDLLHELRPEVLRRVNAMIADNERRLDRRRVDLALMEAIGLGQGATGDFARGILFLSFELSSHGDQFGPFAQSHMCVRLIQKQLLDYGHWLRETAARLDLPEAVKHSFLDDTTEGRRHWQSDLPFPVVNGIDAAVNAGCLGMMFATTQDMRRYVDTMLDTPDRIDHERVGPQVTMLAALLHEALQAPMPISGSRLNSYYSGQAQGRRWEGMAAMAAPGEGQLDLGVPNAVIYARSVDAIRDFGVKGIGVRDQIVLMTDAEGRYAVDDIMHEQIRFYPLRPEVYVFDKAGRIVQAMDELGTWEKPVTGHQRILNRLNQRGEMFDCAQIGLIGIYDTRHLEDLDKVKPVEAARGAEARQWFHVMDAGLCSVFLPTGIPRWQMVFARGDSERRMLLLNTTEDNPEGEGFPLDWRQKMPLVFTSAVDFARLNEHRISRLEATGVVDSYLREQHERGQEQARLADETREKGDSAAAWRHATSAMGLAAQAYRKTRATADDVIHAVLFLLVGLVPFCYFVERLVIGATHVYRQIAGFAALFVVMAAVVGTFHPAFRISMTPVTILLAFLILFLSVLVIAIVMGKFRRELERLRRQDEECDGAARSADDFCRFDALHRAMLLGIANMRRRKVRTALTLVTLVLLAFVIMSFTNPVTHLHPLHYDLTGDGAIDPQRNGVLVQRLSQNPMPAWVLDHLRTAYGDQATVAGHWWITLNDLRTLFPRQLKITGPQTTEGNDDEGTSSRASGLLSAIMCIEPIEARMAGLARYAGADALKRFEDDPDALLISRDLADRVKAGLGDRVEMFGATFSVAGVLADRDMRGLTGFNGQVYAPTDYMSYARLDPEKAQQLIDLAEDAERAADATRAATAERSRPVSSDQFIIMRASRAIDLGATLRSVLLVPNDPSRTMALADDLAGQIRRPIFASTNGKVTLCAATEVTGLTGIGNVIVPLLISALIIFNTMLNCVYERQREIGIMMSVGLAPMHVGALFLAEAAAYGTIGVVGGYVIGQALGSIAGASGWIPGISLNFSSSAAVFTQLSIMVVVLLSSLWPAWKATRIAAPSAESTWKLPVPEGDVMEVALPFTMHGHDAAAVLAYLREWLAVHTESSLGRFCTGAIEPFAEDRKRGIVAQIWLAPFDLGIMQTVELEIRPGRDPTIHEVRIALRREAGPHSAWVRGNRNFLTELRKRFLLWRTIGKKRQAKYRGMSEGSLAMA